MIDITDDNIKKYIMLNGADKLLTSVSTGFHVLVLNKKNEILSKGFTLATRSNDKLSATAAEIPFKIIKNGKVNKLLLLTTDGKFSVELVATDNLFTHLSLSCFFIDLNLYKDCPTILKNIKLSF